MRWSWKKPAQEREIYVGSIIMDECARVKVLSKFHPKAAVSRTIHIDDFGFEIHISALPAGDRGQG